VGSNLQIDDVTASSGWPGRLCSWPIFRTDRSA